jgi:hypothetical protein
MATKRRPCLHVTQRKPRCLVAFDQELLSSIAATRSERQGREQRDTQIAHDDSPPKQGCYKYAFGNIDTALSLTLNRFFRKRTVHIWRSQRDRVMA